MKKKISSVLLSVVLLSINSLSSYGNNIPKNIAAPTLKWAYGGTYADWCEDGWYSTPAVADLNGDGKNEIIASAYSIVNLDAATGALNYRIGSGHDIADGGTYVGRTWSDIVIQDIDGDGKKEFITAHNKGYVSVYDQNGKFKPGWPKKPTTAELRSLRVADLDQDGKFEIIVGAAVQSGQNLWVYNFDGSLRQGWPQLSAEKDGATSSGSSSPVTENSFAWGVYGDNLSVGNLTGDNKLEIVAPSDVHYICAYDGNGTLLPTNPMYGGRKWGKIGLWESMETESSMENEGWGSNITTSSPRNKTYQVNMAHSGSLITDVDGDGKNEVIVSGNMTDGARLPMNGFPQAGWSKYTALYIFNADRTRYNTNGNDWSASPITGAPLADDTSIIEACQPIPVADDIDGDGKKEIFLPTYDGKLHSFSLDKTEKNSWPFDLYAQSGGVIEYASAPTTADLNNDGFKEVVFTSWTPKKSSKVGSLYILNYKGELLHKLTLPASKGSHVPNGSLASPLVIDADGNGKLDIILNTIYAGVVRYEM